MWYIDRADCCVVGAWWMQIQDPKAGFLVNGFVTVSATVLVLEESVQLTRDGDGASDNLRYDYGNVTPCKTRPSLLVHCSDDVTLPSAV